MNKKIMAAIGAVAIGSTFAFAAVPHEKGEGRGKRVRGESLAVQLNLNETQKAQIDEIRDSSRETKRALHEESRATMKQLREAREANDTARVEALRAEVEADRAQMKALREKEREQIAALLTPEQRAKFEATNDERARRGPHGRHGRGRAHHIGGAMRDLNLTDAQKAQVEEIHRTAREQNKALLEASRATRREMREARKANDTARVESLKATAEAQRAQMKQVHEDVMNRVKSVLTAEQRAQLEARKHNGRGGRR